MPLAAGNLRVSKTASAAATFRTHAAALMLFLRDARRTPNF
jgi:hypothetical protein